MGQHDQVRQQGVRRYRIWVAGRLGSGFAEGIDGMEQQDTGGATTLTGDLIDQSHIYGILDRLRQLGVEVLRFETYWPREQEPPAAGTDHSEHDELPQAERRTREEL